MEVCFDNFEVLYHINRYLITKAFISIKPFLEIKCERQHLRKLISIVRAVEVVCKVLKLTLIKV